MAWNGLSFTAAAELAGALRSGAAIGVQQTVLAAIGVSRLVLFALTVSAVLGRSRSRSPRSFPLAGWCAAPVAERAPTYSRS